ncbi:MAG: Rsd/AlgQ family anti-sigma factor [Thioalkalispiraceae bacterium]|jgi:regulator of sigma D
MTTEQLERRGESLDKLHTLLETRKETLSLYSQLAAMRPFEPDNDIQMTLQEFCEALVDYTASAHFQLYQYIEDGSERRADVKEAAKQVYPSISSLTKMILDFNEKYECDEDEDITGSLAHLDSDLSKLGEILADRILLEDQIIDVFSARRLN